MRRAAAAALLAAAAVGAALLAACGRRGPDPRVLVVGVDGADWEMILPMAERGELPTFARLLREGARAPARTLEPPLSPLLWTSIATGKNPDEHGILDFVTVDPRSGRTVPVTSTLRRVKAVWNIATEMGKRVAVVGWLASWPAEEVDGVVVTDRVALHPFDPAGTGRASSGLTYPEGLAAEVARLVPDPSAVPFDSVAPFLAVPREVFEAGPFDAFRPGQLVGNFRRTLAAAEGYRGVARALCGREEWDLFLVYFEFLDATSHLFVRHMPPAFNALPPEEAAAFGGAVEAAYRWQDRVLGEILACRDERTIVLVVSDHGFLFGERRIGAPSEVIGGEAAAWHRDEGIFLVAGPGVRRGETLSPVSILDVTPTILWLLGLPVAEDMAGRPVLGAFEPEFRARRPVATRPTFETGERAAARAAEGEDDAAITERLRALGYLASEGVNAVVNRAILLRDRGDFAASAAEWEKAKAMAPTRADVAVGLGFARYRLGARDEARREWERALSLDPRCVEALIDLGNLAYEEGDLADARARYDAAIRADSLATDAYVNLAQTYLDEKRFRDAAEILAIATAIAPGDARARFRFAVALAELGGTERPLEEFGKALELDRGLAIPVGIWFARLYERGRDDESAAAQYEQVVAAAPRLVEPRLRLARVYARLGKRDRAGQQYVEVLRIEPENAEAKEGLDALARAPAPQKR